MKSKTTKRTEFVIRYTEKPLDEYLIHKGFFAIKKDMYENLDLTHRIELKDGIKFVSYTKGSIYGDSQVEAQLNFIPEIPIIDYILRQINFIR